MRLQRAPAIAVALAASSLGLGLGLALGGCSLLTSLDGLSNGVGDRDGATVEAGGDASDAGAKADAPSDAAPTALDGGLLGVDPCVAGITFCDRFERPDVQGAWALAYVAGGATLTLDPTAFTSPTRSLAIHLPTGPDARGAMFSPEYANVAHVRVAFDMKMAAPSRSTGLLRIQLQDANSNATLNLYSTTDRLLLSEQTFGTPSGPYVDYPIGSAFQPDTWQHWTVELDASASPARAVLAVNGTEIVRTPLANAFPRNTLQVLLGAIFLDDGPARDISFDDVGIQILP